MKALGPGARVANRYVLEAVIAKGGMGAVYRAIDERLGRTVAIKVLLSELAEDQTSVTRFEREASASARLTHPAIVQVFDFGKHEGLSYIVMELVVGRTLATELEQERRLDPIRACDLIEQALGGIHAAHEAGIVHRDLKPGNIMIVPTGGGREVVKVLDFGIAQLKESAPYARLTKSGAVLGTPTFMSPEQARGEQCDGRTDVYAMGVVLWCCMTGQRPFVAADVPTTLGKVLGEMPPRADKLVPSIPASIAHATERAMEKRPTARYPSAAAFAEALMEAREQATIPATAAVSSPPGEIRMPPGRGSEVSTVTREMSLPPLPSAAPPTISSAATSSPGVVASATIVSSPGVRSVPTPAPAVPAAPAGGTSVRRWILAVVLLALVLGIVFGALAVLGVIELERDGVDLRGLPTSIPVPTTLPGGALAPGPQAPALVPTGSAPTQGAPTQGAPTQAVAGVGVCGQLRDCCEAYRARVRPDFPQCEQFVGFLQGDEALCADRIVMFQQMSAGTELPECMAR